ncbi:MAG: S8 family serine peptidase [Acidobacteria bacterium]|nr:S8 family serine peptidase [Acidobacteriota bacterium]MBI3424691.1 S8 family serine peptidase [Acidobacteriota bacterium]
MTTAATAIAFQPHEHNHQPNRFGVIPTPVRLNAVPEFTGKGVTIAFLDAGFYPHPDLTQPVNRIAAYFDIVTLDQVLNSEGEPEATAWHGTQTSVTAAGNGFLSNGVYRGLASDARVVLVKVGEDGRIKDENVARGIRWVIANRERYDIRILSISLGGDEDVPHRDSIVDQAAEEAVAAGIVVIAAAGNSGCSENYLTAPPANSPSVIAVGGYNDHNQLEPERLEPYCSNYGVTADGIVKPEIIAPAMWVAAPVLPNTPSYRQAVALDRLVNAPDYALRSLAREMGEVAGLPSELGDDEPLTLRAAIETALQANKFISTHYQHVDGTSFAAPIAASVVAQMLEANPALTPAAVRHILVSTADRLVEQPLLRQGYGVLNARRAVEQALREEHSDSFGQLGAPRVEAGKLVFTHHDDEARSVALAGDFNDWNWARQRCARDGDGIWRTELPLLVAGRYRYKFVIDGVRWQDDPGNGMKEPDEYGGFNSILHIA